MVHIQAFNISFNAKESDSYEPVYGNPCITMATIKDNKDIAVFLWVLFHYPTSSRINHITEVRYLVFRPKHTWFPYFFHYNCFFNSIIRLLVSYYGILRGNRQYLWFCISPRYTLFCPMRILFLQHQLPRSQVFHGRQNCSLFRQTLSLFNSSGVSKMLPMTSILEG